METRDVTILEHATPAQRVAFAVAVGYRGLPAITDAEGAALARRALDAAARWAAGEEVDAGVLTDYLMNEREEGLLLFEDRCPDDACRKAWMPLQTALAYAAWQAWRSEGRMPAAMLSEVGEETLALLCEQAAEAGQSRARLEELARRVAALGTFGEDDVRRLGQLVPGT